MESDTHTRAARTVSDRYDECFIASQSRNLPLIDVTAKCDYQRLETSVASTVIYVVYGVCHRRQRRLRLPSHSVRVCNGRTNHNYIHIINYIYLPQCIYYRLNFENHYL